MWGVEAGSEVAGCILDGCLSPAPPLPHQDALCTPARRLLQDSRDVPVMVAPLRAERVLLFDDVLVLLQVGGGRPEVWGPQWGPGVWLKKVGKRQGGGSENVGSWGRWRGGKAEGWVGAAGRSGAERLLGSL